MTTMLLGYMQYPVLLYFCGQLSNQNIIAANALAISLCNLLIGSSLMGFNNCMDTYMSNAAGKNDLSAVRKYYDRDKMALLCLWLCLYMVLIATPFLFKYINYEEEFIEYLHEIIWIYGIAVLVHGYNDLNYKLFVNLGYANIPAVINIIAIVTHIMMCYTIILHFNLSFCSAPICQLITESVILIVNLIIVYYLKLHNNPCSMDLKYLSYIDMPFIKLGLWSITQIAIEWWAFELVTIMVGSLGIVEITIQALNIILIDINYFIAMGIGSATAYFVGGSLSAGYKSNAKKYCIYSIILYIFISIPFAIFLFSYPYQYINMMTIDKIVQDRWVELFQKYLWILLLTDSLQTVLAGTIRGLGLQFRSFWVNLVYWVWCVPMTYMVVYYWDGDLLMNYNYFNYGSYAHVLGYFWILFRAEWRYFKLNSSAKSSFCNLINKDDVKNNIDLDPKTKINDANPKQPIVHLID